MGKSKSLIIKDVHIPIYNQSVVVLIGTMEQVVEFIKEEEGFDFVDSGGADGVCFFLNSHIYL